MGVDGRTEPCAGTRWSWVLEQEGTGSPQKGSGAAPCASAAALATSTVCTPGLGTGEGQVLPVTLSFRAAKAAGVESLLVPSQGDPGK